MYWDWDWKWALGTGAGTWMCNSVANHLTWVIIPRMEQLIYQELSPQQRTAVEALTMGMNKRQAAEKANVHVATVAKWLKQSHIQRYMSQLQTDTSDMISVTKPKVVQMLMEAIEDAKLQADPGVQIKGLRELGLMLGFYAPEEKRISYTNTEAQIQRSLTEMSEKDLLAMAGNATNVIEGDFKRVE